MTLRLIRDDETPRPLGIFHSITTRDAAGQERDGQPYYDWKALDGVGPQIFEVQFADGTWMLADPQELDAGRFLLGVVPDHTWPAVEYGEPSEGRPTPVVTRAALQDVLNRSRTPHVWDGNEVTLTNPGQCLRAREDGLYDLGSLGWAFELEHDSATRREMLAADLRRAGVDADAIEARVTTDIGHAKPPTGATETAADQRTSRHGNRGVRAPGPAPASLDR